MILRNQAKCLECGDHIVSTYQHDYRTCKCGNLSVDGGTAYMRRTFAKRNIEETSVRIPDVPVSKARSLMDVLRACPQTFVSVADLQIAVAEEASRLGWPQVYEQAELQPLLSELVSYGLVLEDHECRKGLRRYARAVELAPWPEDS